MLFPSWERLSPAAWLVLSHTADHGQGPLCWLNCRKGSNATCRLLGLTTAAGCGQEPGASGLELEVGSQKPRRRGESEPPPRPHWLSHQRQTLSLSVWEGGKSCFHFLSQSSRTVAHRQEETEKPCPPAPHKLLKSKVLEEVGGGAPLRTGIASPRRRQR